MKSTIRATMHAYDEHDSGEMPTVPGWAAAAIIDLKAQIDRLQSGQACQPCLGAGSVTVEGRAGQYVRLCGTCDGKGLKS